MERLSSAAIEALQVRVESIERARGGGGVGVRRTSSSGGSGSEGTGSARGSWDAGAAEARRGPGGVVPTIREARRDREAALVAATGAGAAPGAILAALSGVGGRGLAGDGPRGAAPPTLGASDGGARGGRQKPPSGGARAVNPVLRK